LTGFKLLTFCSIGECNNCHACWPGIIPSWKSFYQIGPYWILEYDLWDHWKRAILTGETNFVWYASLKRLWELFFLVQEEIWTQVPQLVTEKYW
jgi:hypothetical protein